MASHRNIERHREGREAPRSVLALDLGAPLLSATICVVTAGHLATCPRMLKAADALAGQGYRVRVVSTRRVDWAVPVDVDLRRTRLGQWTERVIDYRRTTGARTYWRSGLRARAAQVAARACGPGRVPLSVAARAYARVHTELLHAALAEPAELFYGGTAGALAAVAEAARRTRKPYGLDLEDFHSAEQDDSPAARLAHALAERIEAAVLPGAALLTTASPEMAQAYERRYGVRPLAVNNTFPLPATPPPLEPSPGDGLRLAWFSQTVGPGRGLEDAIRAMGLARLSGELHLRGRAIPGYVETLRRLARETAPRLTVFHQEPAADPIRLCAGFDVGLALEQVHVLSRAVSRTNKAFTYMLAGLAVAFTDTPGQRPLALDLGEGAWLSPPGDVAALASGLRRWAMDKMLLGRAKAAAWEAARRRWHWEHPDERDTLLGAVAQALNAPR